MQMNFGNALGTNNFSYLLRYFMGPPQSLSSLRAASDRCGIGGPDREDPYYVTSQMTLDARGKKMTLPHVMYWSSNKVRSRIDVFGLFLSVVQGTYSKPSVW